MTRRPTDNETPLEKTLSELPMQAAPGDLQDRCLAVLDAAESPATDRRAMEGPAISRPAVRRVPWNQFAIAAAASIVIAIIALPLLSTNRMKSAGQPPPGRVASAPGPMGPGGPGPGAPGGMPAATAPAPSRPKLTPQQELKLARSYQDDTFGSQSDRVGAPGTASPAPGGPGGGPGGPGAPGGGMDQVRLQARTDEAERAVAPRAPGSPPPAEWRQPRARQAVPSAVPSPTPEPWYDRSDERVKISSRDMEIETPDVEKAFGEAVTIVEKAGGYIATVDLVVQDRKRDSATFAARVPTNAFDGVVQQLRGLGKLVKLTGTSEDRTIEYRSRGMDIRGLSLAEDKLVQRYERETNLPRKAAIKLELDELRRTLHDEKAQLKVLAAQAAFGYLNVEITEGSHFWQRVKDGAGDALPIAMALALVALPFFVVTLIWRRRA